MVTVSLHLRSYPSLCQNCPKSFLFTYTSMNKNYNSCLCKCRNLEIPLPIKSPVTPLPCHWDQVTLNHFGKLTNLRIDMNSHHRSIFAFSFKWFMLKSEIKTPSLLVLLPPSPVHKLNTGKARDTPTFLDTKFPEFIGCLGSSVCSS